MELKLIVASLVSDAGSNKANEDICGSTPQSAWVLDGATGLGVDDLIKGQSAAAWLVGAYHRRLQAAGARRDVASVNEVFRRLITKVMLSFKATRQRAPKHRHEEPSAGMVFVRLGAQRLEWASLGDCRAIMRDAAGAITVTKGSPLLRQLDNRAVAGMTALRKRAEKARGRQVLHSELLAAIMPRLRRNRSRLNTENGYWVLGTDRAAAAKLDHGRIEFAEARLPIQGLLVSDGFYRLVDTFEMFEDGQLLDAARQPGGLGSLLAKLRELEEKDPECRSWMRLKPRDDATAVLFEVAPG